MKYKREQVTTDHDLLEVSKEEWTANNEMFKEALKNRYPGMDVSGIKYNTVIMTDERFRTEFKIRITD